jgi:hypothetical protein
MSDLRPLITFPARPVNGGRLEDAPPKIGPWIVQPKIDDWRAIVHVPTGLIWNRHGELMTDAVVDKLDRAMCCLPAELDWLDVGIIERRNQLLRGSIVVFDWIPDRNDILAGPHGFLYHGRRDALRRQLPILPFATELARNRRESCVFLINEFNPLDIWEHLQEENRQAGSAFYEGIVCKRTDKPYPVQLQSPDKETPWMIKHRFDQ